MHALNSMIDSIHILLNTFVLHVCHISGAFKLCFSIYNSRTETKIFTFQANSYYLGGKNQSKTSFFC